MKLHTPLLEEANDGGSTLLSAAADTTEATTTTQATATTTTSQTNPHANDDPNNPPRFDFRSALDEKGAFKEKWTDSLPDHLKDSAGILGKYPTLEAAMNGLVNAQRKIGKQQGSLKAPAPDAPQAEHDKYQTALREALHIPADVKDYKIELPKELPEGVKLDEAKMTEFTALAHKLNIRPEAAKELVAFQAKEMAGMYQQGQAKMAEYVKSQSAEIQQTWGDQAEANMQKALAAAEKLGLDPKKPELGNNAAFIKAMYEASKLMQPDSLISGGLGVLSSDAKAQADDILHNKSNPWHNAYLGKEGPQRQEEAQQHRFRLLGYKK